MTVKFLENTHKTLINPIKIKQKASKTQESKEISEFKQNSLDKAKRIYYNSRPI